MLRVSGGKSGRPGDIWAGGKDLGVITVRKAAETKGTKRTQPEWSD